MRAARAALLLLALPLPLPLAGCQLAPVYSGGQAGPAQAMLGAIEVAPIADANGFLVRDRLIQRLQPGGAPRYRLDVVLDDRIIGFGVRGDNSIIRERRTLRARYRLVELATGEVKLDTTASADAGIDVVSSEYAVVAAEATAVERLAAELAEQIVARLALLARAPVPRTLP